MKLTDSFSEAMVNKSQCGVRGCVVECWPCNHEVPSSNPGSGSQLWDFSLAHTFGASTGVVPRKQNQEISTSCKNLFLNRCKVNMFKLISLSLTKFLSVDE